MDTTTPRLRVMTYNIRGGLGMDNQRRIERVSDLVRECAPDVAGLQEVHCRLLTSGLVDQPRRLARLTGLRATFRSSFSIGVGAYGNLWLTRERPLGVRRRRLPIPGSVEPRAVVCIDLELRGRLVCLLGTHFGVGREEKRRQAQEVAALLAEGSDPVVLVGDLNSRPDSLELETVLGAGLRHAVPPEALTYPAGSVRYRIDYILVSEHWEVARGEAIESLASDHLPLVADLVLRR